MSKRKEKTDLSTKDFFKYFKDILGYHFYTFNILNILVGLLDGLGLAMFLPLLGLATGTNMGSDSLGKLNILPKLFASLGIPFDLLSVLILMVIIFTLKGFVLYLKQIYFIKLRLKAIRTIRYNLIDSLKSLSYRGYTESDPGHIQFTMISETGRLVGALTNFIKTIEQIVVLSTYVALAFISNWKFALLVAVGGIASNFIYKRINNLTRKEAKNISTQGSNFNSYLVQSIQNFKYLKSTNSFSDYEKRLKTAIYKFEQTQYKIAKLNNIGSSIREPLTIIIISAVLIVFIYILGGSFGSILISLLFFYRALTYLVGVQNSWNQFIANSAALDAIQGLFKNFNNFKEPVQNNSDTNLKCVDSIEIKNGLVKYGEALILNDINLKIDNKKTIAFIGESGAGKSTLANVIGGLVDLNHGQFLVNNQELDLSLLDRFRNRIGYIAQEPIIFNDTIFNNVTFWSKKTEENLKKFRECIELVHLTPMLDNLDLKEDAPLGNNGILISGGQKQRISIARELYRNIDLLIMDEATSALDTETENYIKRNIEELHGKYMMVIIAHRLSTIKHADVIYLMKNGKIINSGNFDELYEKSDQFKKMVNLQEI